MILAHRTPRGNAGRLNCIPMRAKNPKTPIWGSSSAKLVSCPTLLFIMSGPAGTPTHHARAPRESAGCGPPSLPQKGEGHCQGLGGTGH